MHARFRMCLAALGAACLATSAMADVKVTGGAIHGEALADGSTVYRGIPYAAPPVGKLRWVAPQAVTPWTGVRDATKIPAPCAQANEGWNAWEAGAGKEDCLYLSVHAPKHEPGQKLPVFLWIHGGSNHAGSGYGTADSPIYKHGIVVVSIEYRLGVFGFLASPELSNESPRHSSGNYGLLDQMAALQWVRRNIAAFGGDPAKVTVGGQSAGSVDVGMLMRSPLTHGLFARAIQESGGLGVPRTMAQAEGIGSGLYAKFDLPAGAEGLAKLRAMPAADLIAQADTLTTPEGPGTLWMAAVADGWVLSGNANDVYRSGPDARVPLIVGNNTKEFDMQADAAPGLIRTTFGRDADKALKLYGINGDQAPPDDPVLGSVGTQALTDLIFRCPANLVTHWQIAAKQKVWRYEFGLPRPGAPTVAHNAELDYVFSETPKDAAFATWPPVQRYWANFIKTGNPNGQGLPEWRDAAQEQTYMAFTPEGPKPGKDLRGPICRLMADSHAK